MIDIQEYIEAGFTPAQAQLLVARDQRYSSSVEALRSDMRTGFADLRAAMLSGFNAVDDRLGRVDERLDTVDARLNAIDARLNGIDAGLDRQSVEIGMVLDVLNDHTRTLAMIRDTLKPGDN